MNPNNRLIYDNSKEDFDFDKPDKTKNEVRVRRLDSI